jgi:two-component system, LytTR family, response regulator
MRVLRVAIVDDEPVARMRLRRLLSARLDVEVVGDYPNGRALVSGLANQSIDVLLLDVSMPEIDGFATLSLLPKPLPAIIFVTAHSSYAVHAFDAEAVDYLLKPVSHERLAQAMDRAAKVLRNPGLTAPGSQDSSRLGLKIRSGTQYFDSEVIDYVTAHDDQVEVHCGNRVVKVNQTLLEVERQLGQVKFVRIHRSCIIRIAAVQEIMPMPSGRYRMRFRDGQTVFSGRSFQARIRKAFGLRQA